jgi:hypothetical protein
VTRPRPDKRDVARDAAWQEVLDRLQDVRRVDGSHPTRPGTEQSVAYESFVESLLARFLEGFAARVDSVVAAKGAGAVVELGDPQVLADRMTAVLPHPHAFDKYGPFYRASDVASWLGESRQSIHKKVKGRALLGAHDSEGGMCLPVWQFRDDGTQVPHLREIVNLLAAGTSEPWTWIQWLAEPDDASGIPAWQSLDSEEADQIAVVTQDARRDAARWAS